jgi:hypothetical protein
LKERFVTVSVNVTPVVAFPIYTSFLYTLNILVVELQITLYSAEVVARPAPKEKLRLVSLVEAVPSSYQFTLAIESSQELSA